MVKRDDRQMDQVDLFGGCFVICLLYPPKGLKSEKNGKKIEHQGCIMYNVTKKSS